MEPKYLSFRRWFIHPNRHHLRFGEPGSLGFVELCSFLGKGEMACKSQVGTLPLKLEPWKFGDSGLGKPSFLGAIPVSFRECLYLPLWLWFLKCFLNFQPETLGEMIQFDEYCSIGLTPLKFYSLSFNFNDLSMTRWLFRNDFRQMIFVTLRILPLTIRWLEPMLGGYTDTEANSHFAPWKYDIPKGRLRCNLWLNTTFDGSEIPFPTTFWMVLKPCKE